MIEPSTFDAIMVGTGLPESILAASVAASGKTVLHLDACEGYLSPWASLSFSHLGSFASRGGCLPKSSFFPEEELTFPPKDVEYTILEVKDTPTLYSHVKVLSAHDESALGRLNRFSLDLAGPKVVFCAGPLVDALINAYADHHVRFKAVETELHFEEQTSDAASLISTKDGLQTLALYLASTSRYCECQSLISLTRKVGIVRAYKLPQVRCCIVRRWLPVLPFV